MRREFNNGSFLVVLKLHNNGLCAGALEFMLNFVVLGVSSQGWRDKEKRNQGSNIDFNHQY